MSYGLVPYLANIEHLAAMFPAKEGYYKNLFIGELSYKMDKLQEQFEPGEHTFNEVMLDLFSGKISWPDVAYMYWYVVEAYIDRFEGSDYSGEGEILEWAPRLNNSEWYPANANTLSRLYKFKELKLFGTSPHIVLPHPEDFPVVFVIQRADMKPLLEQIAQISDSSEQQEQFKEWLTIALKTQNDLLIFYY